MAEANYTSKIKYNIDDLMSSLVACKTQAEQVDGVLANIGKRGNLNNFIKQFVAMDDAVKALRKELDSIKAGLGDKLNSGWMKSFDEMVKKMSQISELSKNVFEGLNGVNLKDKGAAKELRSYAEQLNVILKNVGIDKQIDLEIFSTKDVEEQFNELIKYASELNGKLNVAFGEIDLSKFGDNIESAGDKASGNIKEAGGKISAEVQQQIDELEKQKSKYQEALDIFSGKKVKVKTTKKNDVAELTSLVDEFKKAEVELSSKRQGSSDYEAAFARKVKAATLLKNTADYVVDYGSVKGSEYVSMHTEEYENAEKFLKSARAKQSDMLEKMKSECRQKIQEINIEVSNLTNTIESRVVESAKNATDVIAKMLAEAKNSEKFLYINTKKGTSSDFITGDQDSVSKDKMQDLLSEFGGADKFDSTLHTHNAKFAVPSGENGDLDVFLSNFDKFKKNFILAGEQLAEIDFSSLTKEQVENIKNRFEEKAQDIDISNYDEETISSLTTLTSDIYSKVGDAIKNNFESMISQETREKIGDDNLINNVFQEYVEKIQNFLKTADVGNLTHGDIIDEFDKIATDLLQKYPENIRKQLKNNLSNSALTGFDDVTGIQDILFNKTQQELQDAFISSITESGFDASKIFKLYDVNNFDFKTFKPLEQQTQGDLAQLEKEKELMQEIAALKEKLSNIPPNPVDASELEAAQKQVQELEKEILRMEGALDSWRSSYYDIQQTLDYSIPISEVEQNMTSNDVVDAYRSEIETLKSTINQLNEELATTKALLTDVQTSGQSAIDEGDTSLIDTTKKIQSYEELCEIVERYNELVVKGSRTSEESKELDTILNRVRATRGELTPDEAVKDVFKWQAAFSGIGGMTSNESLAKYLGIEIPQAASSAGASIDNLKTKAEDLKTKFFELTQSLDSDLFAGNYDEFSLGKNQAELDKAQQELQELADSGYIAADAMEQVNAAYKKTSDAITASYEGIKNENIYKEDSGSYDRGYEDGYFAAEKRYEQDVNSYLHEINELTKRSESLEAQLSQMQSTKDVAATSSQVASESANIATPEIDSANKATEAFAAATAQKNQFVEANAKVKESAEASAVAIEKEIEKARDASEAFASATQAKNDFANANQNAKDNNETDTKKKSSKKKTSGTDSSSNNYKEQDNYKTLIDANKKLSSAFKKIDTEVFVDKDSDLGQLKTRYEEITNKIQELTKSEEAFSKVSEDDLQKLSLLTKQLMTDIEKYAKAKNEASKQNKSVYGANIFEKVQSKYTELVNNINNNGYSNASGITNKLQQYEQAYQRIITLQKELANIDITSDLGKQKAAEFDSAVESFNKYGKQIENIIKKSEELKDKVGNMHRTVSEGFDLGSESSRRNELEAFANSFDGLDKKSIQFQDNYSKVIFTIKNGNGEIEKITGSFNKAGTAIDFTSKNLGSAKSKFSSFFDGIKRKTGEIATYFTGASLVYRTVAQIRQGITYVKEIDTALTELKKVTDETDETYAQFLKTMAQTGAEVGATVSNLTNMAASWARLGYSIQEAGELAKSTAVLLNVSEFADADSASEALISTMQAYGYAAEDSMHIVDVLNEVGNNFAISSDGLATALQDSASSLMAAGNNLEQSVAMVAAANKVLQDPNSVGAALRTISLRIRGTSTKVLEEMGEETDGVIESVSKLQAKVKGLSGVDILTDTGAYKDTYTIIKEIAQVWDQMNDIDRAALLELLAGKNRSNAMAALLTNLEDLEGAYESAMEAQGSAEAENEKYLNSIQGKIDLFNNAVQTMWKNFISSDAIKFIVDLGTKFIQLVDKVGVLQSALIALAAIKILPKFAKGIGLTNLISDIFTLTNGLKDFANGSKVANAATLSTAMATSLAESSLVKLAIQMGITTAEEVATASATTLLGFSFKALGLSILGAAKAVITFLATNPIGWAILAVSAIIGLVAAIGSLIKTHDDYVEELKNTNEEIENLRSNIESLNSELETTKNRIEELESKGPLTITEQEELDKLKEQNAELERQIQLEKAREERARNKQAKAAQKAFETDDDFKVQPSNRFTVSKVTNTFEQKLGAIEIAKEKLDKAEIALQDALNSGMDTNSNKFKKLEKNLESAQEDYTDAQSNWDEFIKGKEDEYGDLEWFDGDNLTEAQKTVNEIISSMQNYNDRAEIMFGSAGAKESALNRLFGERGSEAGQAFQEAFNAKIESGEINVEVDRFGDYSAAIENVTGSVEELISKNPQFKVQLDSLGISAEDVARYFLNISSAMQQTNETTSVAITDIASLTSAYDSYASALQIVNDTIFDGQAISDDYYNSLKEYLGDVTVGEESFSDAVDTTNGKVIKNTRLLRNLIAQKKKEQKATASAAKAQSQLQYTKIVKQLQQAVKAMYLDYKAYGYVTNATYDNINALRSQVQAIKSAIREYAILELKLSDVTNAYDEFEDAKNRDAELAYGDSMVEMLQTISDGFLSGQVGSEAFKAACEALVPPSVIANCKTFEERLDAIDDYFENSKFADYFTIDEDGNFSIGMKNIEAFIADAKEAGAFLSNADGTFTLDNSIKSVDDLANAMGLTKAATIAMLTELAKYDASWGDIVADITMTKLDKNIRDTTNALDEAIAKQEQFFREGKDPSGANAEEYNAIQQDINNCSDALNNAQQAVVNNTKAWIDANNKVDTAKENVATLTSDLQKLQAAGATDNEIQIKTNELEKAKEQLSEALKIKYGLEEPTQMDFQLVLTDVQSQIEKWKEENSTLVTEVVPKLAQDEDGVWKIPAELELDEDQQARIQEYVDLKNSEQQLELLNNQEVDPITDGITQVKEVLDNILKAITGSETTESDQKSTSSSSGTSSTKTSSSTTNTPTSGTTGFESGSVDQDIAAWNAMVDEWIANTQQYISQFGEGISKFFIETLPEYWNSFWNAVGEQLGQVGEWAQETGAEIGIFFTETLPQKWSEFWAGVEEWLDDVKTWAAGAGEDIGKFFTETLPEKWSEFWGKVGEFISEIPYNVSYLVNTIKIFFTETVPEKWDEFWDNVGEVLNDLKEKAKVLKDKVVEFFKVTVPQKWDEFWDAVGNGLNTLKENAIALKDKLVEFFTVTIPAEWNAFWDSVSAYVNEVIIPALSSTWNKVYEFFTTTVPAKWNEFWASVGTYIDEVIKPALSLAWNKVHDFFMVTIPEKWNEFWTGVGDFVTQTIPEAFEAVKDGVSTFFTETVPDAINGLWESAASWISEKANSFWSFLKGEWIRGKEDAETGTYNPKGASGALGNALAKGNAHSKKKPGLGANEHNAIVGELGRELVVDPNKGIYYTVGEHGTQMLDLPKGAIIYNHKQTEELLKNGETSRGTYTGGLSFAKGNAYWNYGTYTKKTGTDAKAAWGDGSDKDWSQMGWDLSDAASDLSDAASDVSDAADDAEQTIDFIEYKLEEIESAITHMTNRVENFLDDTSQIGEKNRLYEDLVGAEKQKASTYFAAAELYNKKAAQLLSKVPSQYQEMAKNGAIAIKDFIGESEGEIADAIEEYRTWSTKAEDAENNYLASIAEISAKRLEQLQDIADDFENIVGLTERQSDLLQGEMDLLEEAGERLSENFYKELMKDSQKQIADLNNKRASLQDILDQAVKSGDVRVGTDDWYEMVNAIYDVDDSILECKKDIEGFQNSINDLYWDNLDKLIEKIDSVDSELSHLYNLVSDEEKVVDEFGNWTKDGITALGLLAQQLEVANFKVEQYGEAIARLEKDYAAGLYSTDEYNEKLAELKENQWDAIEAQESAKKSIIDLNKTRIQAVKDGIQKEIDAYSELIDKKKEELNLQKEAHDFSKQVAEKQKEIADIQKRLAVIAGDNSAAAIAQKKKLQAELAQAQEDLDELYYDHSIEKQQEALDKSLEDYQNNKQDEMDALDESLKNENQIIQDSYATVAANTESLAQNLSDIADKYGITLSESVTKPWLDGANAIGTYQEKLDTSTSAFTDQLKLIKQELADLQVEADKTANSIINATNGKKDKTESAKYTPPAPAQQPSTPSKPATPAPPSKGASVTVKKSATNFSRNGGNGTRMQSWVPGSTFTVYQVSGSEVLIGRNGGYTGWVRLSDIEGYAKGTKSIDKDKLAFLDELGDELQLVPDGAGRLSYVKKGTGIIPADLTERLMEWGQLDPSSVLEQSKPTVSAPHIINNNIELNMQIGEVVHIDRADNGSIPNITKAVQDQMDNYMKNINKKLYNRVR